MNNTPDKIRVIDPLQLNEENYFQSLLADAYRKDLLSRSDIERLHADCLHLLAYQAERYNAGDSSSIRIEKAQDIMISLLFTIGLWLKTYPNPDDAVIALQSESIQELYQKGRKRIDAMIAATKIIHAKLLKQLMDTPNVYYSATLREGILGFFKLYDPDYGAQEIHITADYPLCNSFTKLAGIEFIKTYVEAAYYENQFCCYFSADDIHHLLSGYAEDYKELLINMYEPVLTAAIGCIITGADVYRLGIIQKDVQILHQRFTGQSKKEITAIISEAAIKLNHHFHFPQKLMRYMQNSLPLIADQIEVALRESLLDRIFLLPSYPQNNPTIIFSFGNKMDDEHYRKVVEEIGQCRFSQDKIAIIKEYIHSLADLEDILLDADLAEKEIQNILHQLSLPEIAALSKRYPWQSDADTSELPEREQLLYQNLHHFISRLPLMQQKLLTQARKSIQEE